MDVFKAAAAISPSTFDFYNAETGKHTVSMSYLCKTLLNKEETHKAYDDVIDTNHCLQKVFQQIPEIQGLIEYVSDNDNRDILFESPLLMRLSLSSINGPYSQIISWLTDHKEWGGWGAPSHHLHQSPSAASISQVAVAIASASAAPGILIGYS